MDVMVIEDDPRLRDLYALALRGAGHHVRTAASATQARKMLVIAPADLLILDLDLGKETGLGVATLADYVNPDCRVIVVTGSGLFRHGELFAMMPACAAVVRKPVLLSDLIAMAEHQATRMRAKKTATPGWDAAAEMQIRA